jgi:hypothetical protein
MRYLLTACILALLVIPVSASSPAVTASWEAPTEGSPVVFYVLEIYEDGVLFIFDTTENTSYVVEAGIFQAGPQYTARVRGVDAQDRTGPWSLWSDPYVFDPGPPGGCGPIQWSW